MSTMWFPRLRRMPSSTAQLNTSARGRTRAPAPALLRSESTPSSRRLWAKNARPGTWMTATPGIRAPSTRPGTTIGAATAGAMCRKRVRLLNPQESRMGCSTRWMCARTLALRSIPTVWAIARPPGASMTARRIKTRWRDSWTQSCPRRRRTARSTAGACRPRAGGAEAPSARHAAELRRRGRRRRRLARSSPRAVALRHR
mmetsp:Transcript_66599/g.195382  ORF Transcript_66599/g.195382 Transcript_66599/m.195382 type:complete len:201 (+) Transcript_66599:613-1215(+)